MKYYVKLEYFQSKWAELKYKAFKKVRMNTNTKLPKHQKTQFQNRMHNNP